MMSALVIIRVEYTFFSLATCDYQRVTDWPVGLCLSFTI